MKHRWLKFCKEELDKLSTENDLYGKVLSKGVWKLCKLFDKMRHKGIPILSTIDVFHKLVNWEKISEDSNENNKD